MMCFRSFRVWVWGATLAMVMAGAGRAEEPSANVAVGAVNSHVFRIAQTPRQPLRFLGAPPRFQPMSFADQAAINGFRAFHWPVYADPATGGFAKGRAGEIAGLRQPGLKVLLPDDRAPDAQCATLMVCLLQLDAASKEAPDHPLWVVVLDLEAPPLPRWYRLWPGSLRFLAPQPEEGAPPALRDVAWEVNHVLPRERRAMSWGQTLHHQGRLLVVVRGGAGDPPPAAPFLHEADASVSVLPWRDITTTEADEAVGESALSLAIGLDWSGDDDPMRLSAREAARAGVNVLLLTHTAAR